MEFSGEYAEKDRLGIRIKLCVLSMEIMKNLNSIPFNHGTGWIELNQLYVNQQKLCYANESSEGSFRNY